MFGRRRRERQELVIVARGEAASAFTALEESALKVLNRLSFAAHVDGTARGQALLDRARLVSLEADEAVLDWLALESGPDVDDEPGDEPAAATDVELAGSYSDLRVRLLRARDGFERLLGEVGADLGVIEQSLAAIPRRAYDASEALRLAEAEVKALRLEGLAPEAAEQALIRGRQRAEVLAEGAAVHGIAEILAAADEVLAIAEEARRRAEDFPHQRDQVARRLVAVRNHLDVAQDRRPRLDAAITALQRSYADASWHDLAAAPAHFQAALDAADDALEQAQAAARRLAYAPALRLLELARVAVAKAEEQVRVVTGRLAALDTLQADPLAPLAPVQLALDDAQLLCGSQDSADCARSLDTLAERLAAARTLIAGERPDFYGYQIELGAIATRVAGVVSDLRRR